MFAKPSCNNVLQLSPLRRIGCITLSHSGLVIVDTGKRMFYPLIAGAETEEVNSELENQYKHSYEHKITRWNHKGLGFSSEKPAEGVADRKPAEGDNPSSSEVESADKKIDQSAEGSDGKGDNSEVPKDNPTEKVERKRESTETSETNTNAPKKPKMMMNFVKSSDS